MQKNIDPTGLPGGTTEITGIIIDNSAREKTIYDMIVFSHVRWDFLYQRPQHIMSRMSADKKILFVEAPVPFAPGHENRARVIKINKNLQVLQPMVNSIADIVKVLPSFVSSVNRPVAWFYSAMFSVLLGSMDFGKVIYDCIDERTLFSQSFENSSTEKYLLSESDIVFTAGKSLFEAKQSQHQNIHCFPGSVERAHFEKAMNGIRIPSDIKKLRKPIIGYYGVIDDRIDLNLLSKVAWLNPQASFVMIGPIEKITEEHILQQDNIHYLGVKPYDLLPNYLRAFDIAMMPFAMNEATLYLSPTKTLEYMAAGKPVISTPVYDVVRDYKHCLSIVSGADEFSLAIKDILYEHDLEKEIRYEKYKEILDLTSWDNTADIMEKIIRMC